MLTLLLVDDHEGFLDSAERYLGTLPWVSVLGRATSGRQAIEMAEQLEPNVVLMDLSMPEMDGLTATRLIKAQTQPPRVVIVSHYDDPQHREHVARAGADGFVSKLWYVHEVVPVLREFGGLETHA